MRLINSQSLDSHRVEKGKRGGLKEMNFKEEVSWMLKDMRGEEEKRYLGFGQ